MISGCSTCRGTWRSGARRRRGSIRRIAPEVLDEEQAKVEGITQLQGVRDADRRVLRGGSFFDDASNVRSARRFSLNPGNRDVSNGIRVSRTLPP